jgi:ChrR-like protein with cupin domain
MEQAVRKESIMKTKVAAFSVAMIIGCLGASPSWAQSGGHITVTPADLKWVDMTALPPGAKIAIIEGSMNEVVTITARVKFPANYEIPAHWHPAVERATVLSGTFNIGMVTSWIDKRPGRYPLEA